MVPCSWTELMWLSSLDMCSLVHYSPQMIVCRALQAFDFEIPVLNQEFFLTGRGQVSGWGKEKKGGD